MATATEIPVARLKQRYDDEIRAQLKDELGLSSVMQVPRISKITLNMGVGDAKTDAKALDAAIEELSTITGQRAQVRRARKSIASFKLREGMAVGARVTLRGARMYEFLDRLVSIALPEACSASRYSWRMKGVADGWASTRAFHRRASICPGSSTTRTIRSFEPPSRRARPCMVRDVRSNAMPSKVDCRRASARSSRPP